ncbi:MAG TPA: M64 family metallopeptidase [Polyangiaceae bacterium]|nr:M64 family metallopeptidase [Polyangiaceae bacterium]
MQRRFTSFLIPFAACVPTLFSCGSEDKGSELPPGAGTEMPDMSASGDPETPDTPAEMDTPPAEDPGVPGAGEELNPGDIDLDPAQPTQPTQPTEPTPPGELTSPVPPVELAPLDCGADGWAVENAGPPGNRVNYIILADGYDATTINTTLEQHIEFAMDRRFNHESGEPYGRYRKFVNICVMKVVSQTNGIGNGPTAFQGGNGGDRLARVNNQLVNAYLDDNLPETIEVDWRAVVLNQGLWENTGSATMLWSGANNNAPGAALHEGGHGFHQLADEYCASATGSGCGPAADANDPTGQEFREVNSTGNPLTTGGKWDVWLGTVQKGLKVPDQGATGVQGVFSGSRYDDDTQYRPSSNSMMNSLFGNNVNTSFNSVSREQMIFSIWRAVRPVDSTDPPAGAVDNPTSLTVRVVDPAVIDIDWEIDGEIVAAKAGGQLNLAAAALAPGQHTIVAHTYDNATEDLVLQRDGTCPNSVTGNYCHATAWLNSSQNVEWTVTIP